jgi:hypothetical protein
MYDTPLSLDRFEEYFKLGRLGYFYFPNGKCLDEPAERKDPEKYIEFNICLHDLYKSITGWNENGEKQLPLDKIMGVVAFGDAVRLPAPRTRKKWVLFGEKIQTKNLENIQPTHADILVITDGGFEYSPEIIDPSECPIAMREISLGGIRTHLSSYEDFKSIHFNDTIHEKGNPMEGAIILGNDSENLERLLIDECFRPHIISWDEISGGELYGGIYFK